MLVRVQEYLDLLPTFNSSELYYITSYSTIETIRTSMYLHVFLIHVVFKRIGKIINLTVQLPVCLGQFIDHEH